jgi:hypothetical protein
MITTHSYSVIHTTMAVKEVQKKGVGATEN